MASELWTRCPPGGLLGWLGCGEARGLALGSVGLAAVLYVAALSAVLAWVGGLRRRGVANAAAARDWYLLTGLIGLVIMPLLAFTLVSAFR